MNPDDETSGPITYQVQYQEKGRDDWFIMTRRNHDEVFRNESKYGMHELTSVDEAVEIAEALVNGYSHPHKRDARYWRPIVAAKVITIVRLSVTSAVYGTPHAEGST